MDSIRFKASLSNGENFVEGKGDYAFIPGELSPLLRLYKYVQDNGLQITGVSIEARGTEHHLPSVAKNPRFKTFAETPPPKRYLMYRKKGVDMVRGQAQREDRFLVAEAFYTAGSMQFWVNADFPHATYVVWIPRGN